MLLEFPWLAALIPLLLASTISWAQSYPARPVRLVVAGSSGSSMDISARAIAEQMTRSFGVAVVVDVRPGANSVIGAEIVANAPPDGYTLLYVLTTFVQAPHLLRKMPYDVMNSFTPIAQVVSAPLWLGINA